MDDPNPPILDPKEPIIVPALPPGHTDHSDFTETRALTGLIFRF
jgi:hypothetical protein